jgi:hypothetical protein
VSRLAQQYAALYDALEAKRRTDRRAAVQRLVVAAVDANGFVASEATEVGLAERLDEQAWQVQEQIQQGKATQEEYEVAFRRARAASAVQMLADSEAAWDDVAYPGSTVSRAVGGLSGTGRV